MNPYPTVREAFVPVFTVEIYKLPPRIIIERQKNRPQPERLENMRFVKLWTNDKQGGALRRAPLKPHHPHSR